jgi:glutathione peroxidase
MRRRGWLILGTACLVGSLVTRPRRQARAAAAASAYAFSFTAIDGTPLPLEGFRGRPILVVNTASLCGFTDQYAGLQALWERYRERGLVVLGVPSGDFNQEYGSNEKIKQFCETNFAIDFPLTAKVHVRGASAHPLFRWMVDRLGPEAEPRWNFHKVLIDADGQPVRAFPTRVAPEDPQVTSAIEAVLAPLG